MTRSLLIAILGVLMFMLLTGITGFDGNVGGYISGLRDRNQSTRLGVPDEDLR